MGKCQNREPTAIEKKKKTVWEKGERRIEGGKKIRWFTYSTNLGRVKEKNDFNGVKHQSKITTT